MFRSLHDFWLRISARRRLQRRGLVAPRRHYDIDKLADALEGSPAPGIFMLVMIWAISAVLLTISARQHSEGVLNLVEGQQAPRTIIATQDFSYQDAEGTNQEAELAMANVPFYFRIDAKANNAIRRDFTTFFEAISKRLTDENAGRKYVAGNRPAESLVVSMDPALAAAFWMMVRGMGRKSGRKTGEPPVLPVLMLGLALSVLLRIGMIAYIEYTSFRIGTYLLYLAPAGAILLLFAAVGVGWLAERVGGSLEKK